MFRFLNREKKIGPSKKIKVILQSEEENLALLIKFLIIGILFAMLLAGKDYFAGNYFSFLITAGLIAVLCADIVFVRLFRNYESGSLIGIAALAAAIITMFLFDLDGTTFVWVPVFGVTASFLLDRHKGLISSLSFYFLIAIILLLDGWQIIHLPFPQTIISVAPDLLASTLTIFLFAYLFQEAYFKKDELLWVNYEKLARETLKERSVFSTIEMGLAIANSDRAITFINTPGLELLSARTDQVIGRKVEEVFSLFKRGKEMPADSNPLLKKFEQAEMIKIRSYDNFELKRIALGTFPVGMNITYSPTDPENSLIVVFFDLSVEKKIDDLKDAFLSSMQHQISTPFAIVRWNLELLGNTDENLKKMGFTREKIREETQSAVERVATIQSNILTASRIEQGFFPQNLENINLSDLVEASLRDLKFTINLKNLNVKKRYQENIKSIKADKTVLAIIIQNLISNAAKYNKIGGDITIKIEQGPNDVIMEIGDNGIGVPMKDRHRIFEKFFRAENASAGEYQGTGLGLYITKILVDHIQGKIWLKSEEGKGTTFYVLIPNEPRIKYEQVPLKPVH